MLVLINKIRTLFSSHPTSPLCSVPPLFLRNCCTILDLCLRSEIMDGFWSSRCLNDRIDMPHKIGSFSSGTITSMVVKNATKKTFDFFGSKHASFSCLHFSTFYIKRLFVCLSLNVSVCLSGIF